MKITWEGSPMWSRYWRCSTAFTLFCSGTAFLWLFTSPFLLDWKSDGRGKSSLSAAVHCGRRLLDHGFVG